MGPTWVLSAPVGPHVGLMSLAIRVYAHKSWLNLMQDRSLRLIVTSLALCVVTSRNRFLMSSAVSVDLRQPSFESHSRGHETALSQAFLVCVQFPRRNITRPLLKPSVECEMHIITGVWWLDYDGVITAPMASQITSLTIVYSIVYSGADQSKHQSSASLAFVWGIHRGPVNSPHKWPVTRKMFPFDDVIMRLRCSLSVTTDVTLVAITGTTSQLPY